MSFNMQRVCNVYVLEKNTNALILLKDAMWFIKANFSCK